LEIDPKHAAIARANLQRAGLSATTDVRLGPALETLPKLVAEGRGPFDLTFIYADKPGNADYFRGSLKLSRRGRPIVVDNGAPNRGVIDAASADASIQGVRRLNELIAAEPRVSATAIQTVGSKGYDGFVAALVVADA